MGIFSGIFSGTSTSSWDSEEDALYYDGVCIYHPQSDRADSFITALVDVAQLLSNMVRNANSEEDRNIEDKIQQITMTDEEYQKYREAIKKSPDTVNGIAISPHAGGWWDNISRCWVLPIGEDAYTKKRLEILHRAKIEYTVRWV